MIIPPFRPSRWESRGFDGASEGRKRLRERQEMTNREIAQCSNTIRPFVRGNPDRRGPRGEEWLRRGAATARECNRLRADVGTRWFQRLRVAGTFRRLSAAACSVDHACPVRLPDVGRGPHACDIHCKTPPEEMEGVFQELHHGLDEDIVQVRNAGQPSRRSSG